MKKCVKCGTKYDDSEVICSKCNMYLIKDVLSDLSDDSFNKKEFTKNESFFTDANFEEDNNISFFDSSTFSDTGSTSVSSLSNNRRRNRVHPVEEATSNSETVKRRASPSSFRPSEESDDFEEEGVQPTYRRRTYRRNH